jgi:hypothetical protein
LEVSIEDQPSFLSRLRIAAASERGLGHGQSVAGTVAGCSLRQHRTGARGSGDLRDYWGHELAAASAPSPWLPCSVWPKLQSRRVRERAGWLKRWARVLVLRQLSADGSTEVSAPRAAVNSGYHRLPFRLGIVLPTAFCRAFLVLGQLIEADPRRYRLNRLRGASESARGRWLGAVGVAHTTIARLKPSHAPAE